MLLPEKVKIYVYRQAADMRKSYDGLAGLVNNEFGHNPSSGSLYVFFNKRRDMVKLFWYEETMKSSGFTIWMRRLDQGTFQPKKAGENQEPISTSELIFLLEEIKKKRSK